MGRPCRARCRYPSLPLEFPRKRPSVKASRALAALLRIGWKIKRQRLASNPEATRLVGRSVCLPRSGNAWSRGQEGAGRENRAEARRPRSEAIRVPGRSQHPSRRVSKRSVSVMKEAPAPLRSRRRLAPAARISLHSPDFPLFRFVLCYTNLEFEEVGSLETIQLDRLLPVHLTPSNPQ